ncbi:MAG: dihydrolipoyllysine-residue acetyltransferase [Methylococcaceae bacterium]|nr:dihydrolipoyllysine-residue acetyltransferase [Methylococcaceae bacterium]
MTIIEIKVPDVGDVKDIDVVEVLIQAGDTIEKEQTIATLETDKASIDLPSSAAGKVQKVHIKAGDKVSEGSLVITLEVAESQEAKITPTPISAAPTLPVAPAPAVQQTAPVLITTPVETHATAQGLVAHATPSVRLFARELGVDLKLIKVGGGRKGRILQEDVKKFVKQALSASTAASGNGIPPIPAVDFTKFGAIEEQPLSNIKRLTGQGLSRAWLNLPMVTYHDEADITELEAFRVASNSEKTDDAVKLTNLVFIMKALVAGLQQFPTFNSSLAPEGDKLILKKYFNIGVAVDTPNGLVVPVIRDVDQKNVTQLSAELLEKSAKARAGKLMPADMQGGCMTISSLGGLGGTAFTPIVNAPEVAIIGITRAAMKPVWDGQGFIPRLMLPLDLTYDHRVIDGAEGARFMSAVIRNLSDIRRLLL